MYDLEQMINEAIANKEKRKKTVCSYEVILPDKSYYAYIKDSLHNDEKNTVTLTVVIFRKSRGIEKKYSFSLKESACIYYDNLCHMLGSTGNPSELIGKFIIMHIEENQGYKNLVIDSEVGEKEFRKAISEESNGKRKRFISQSNRYDKNEVLDSMDDFE